MRQGLVGALVIGWVCAWAITQAAATDYEPDQADVREGDVPQEVMRPTDKPRFGGSRWALGGV